MEWLRAVIVNRGVHTVESWKRFNDTTGEVCNEKFNRQHRASCVNFTTPGHCPDSRVRPMVAKSRLGTGRPGGGLKLDYARQGDGGNTVSQNRQNLRAWTTL